MSSPRDFRDYMRAGVALEALVKKYPTGSGHTFLECLRKWTDPNAWLHREQERELDEHAARLNESKLFMPDMEVRPMAWIAASCINSLRIK